MKLAAIVIATLVAMGLRQGAYTPAELYERPAVFLEYMRDA